MINANDIEKYKDKSLPALVKLADTYFNRWVRLRDAESPCICCDKGKPEQACHYYSAGNYKALRYNEDNVNGGCKQGNYYMGGNLVEYRKRLIKRIGEDRVLRLDHLAEENKRNGFKWDKYSLIETIITYRNKLKNNNLLTSHQ